MSRAPQPPRRARPGQAPERDVFDPIWARPQPTGRRAPHSRADIADAAIAVADDYVLGFVLRASITTFEPREDEAEPGWMQAVFDYMSGELETGAYPNVRRMVDANRERGGRDEDLPAMALDQGRFERGLERLLDGVEVELTRKASSKRRRGR